MTIPPWFPRRLIVYWQLFIRLENLDHNTFIKSYIPPVLEYGNIIWGAAIYFRSETNRRETEKSNKVGS